MRLVRLEAIKEGSKLGKTIYSADGKVLLGEGVLLNNFYLEKLKRMGINSLYIIDEKLLELEIQLEMDDIISDVTRREAVQVTQRTLDQIVKGKTIEPAPVFSVINSIIDDLWSQEHLLVNLTDIRTFDDYTFAHSVNVAVLSLIIGIALGYDQLKLRNLGVGALLHDLGKIKVPLEILNKEGKLTEEEFAAIRKHPEDGFELVRQNRDLSILVAHVAYQHHEKYDGTGYPRGLKEQAIHKFARIVSIADVYDALISDRPYRPRYLPHEAYEYLMGSCYTNFDPKLVQLFLKHVAPYPLGTIVILNTEEKAVVIQQHPELLLRPTLMVYEKNGKELSRPFQYDLMTNPTVMIKEVVSD